MFPEGPGRSRAVCHWQSARPRTNGVYGILIRGVKVTNDAGTTTRIYTDGHVYPHVAHIYPRRFECMSSLPPHRPPSRFSALTYWFRWPLTRAGEVEKWQEPRARSKGCAAYARKKTGKGRCPTGTLTETYKWMKARKR